MGRSVGIVLAASLLLFGCGGGSSGGDGGNTPRPTFTRTIRTGQVTRTPTFSRGTATPTPPPTATVEQGTRTPTPVITGQRTRTRTPTQDPTLFQTLYVRTTGNDENPGTAPDMALRTLSRAAALMQAGTTVYVGSGRYTGRFAISGKVGTAARPIQLIADTSGARTGSPAGDVIIDADEDIVALILTRSTYVSVDSFVITGALPQTEPEPATATAVQIRTGSNNTTIRNCIISNLAESDGVRIGGSNDVLLFNNLIFENDRGILISGDSQRTRVINNTIVNHQRAGIALTLNGDVAPIDTTVLNNIVQHNENNIAISVAQGPPSGLEGFNGNFNLVFEPGIEDQAMIYNPIQARGANDVNADALFSNVGQGDVHLAPGSPAIDAGTDTIGMPLVNALTQRSTTPDGAADSAPVDLGYHYPR